MTISILNFLILFALSPIHSAETHAKESTGHAHASSGVPAEKALEWLKNGNSRYRNSKLRSDGQSKADRALLSEGQKPHTIVISCSDSRVPPEIIFDQKLGEIFVIRIAGQALDPHALGSVEYAIEHLGVKNILVLGHSTCGAVKAAHATLKTKDAGSENLNALVANIHPRIKDFEGKAASKNLLDEGWANVNGAAKDLKEQSKIISNSIKNHGVEINQALYHLASGEVEFSTPSTKRDIATEKKETEH